MTISLVLRSATGALFLNYGGTSNDRQGAALEGFITFAHGESASDGQLRLESTAWLAGIAGAKVRYRLAFGRGLGGFMVLVPNKHKATDPDYTGFVGAFNELIVAGWNRSVNSKPYVLLNLRENPAAKRQASEG